MMNEIERAWDHIFDMMPEDDEEARYLNIALEALQDKAERDDPKPLTIEELREMGGQPVWTVGVSCVDNGSWSMWDIVESVNNSGITFGYSTEHCEWWNYNLRGNDGKMCGCAWLAYRYPPKEVQANEQTEID